MVLSENKSLTPEQATALSYALWFDDGVDAAMRIGKYAGASDIPPCPCQEGTAEHLWWTRGFDYGTECLVHGIDPDAELVDEAQ